MGGLTVAIRVVEGHARGAGGQQHLLQQGRGDVFGVEQAGAMARSSEGHICGARKRPGSKARGGRGRGDPKTSLRLRHLPAAGPGRAWNRRRGRRVPRSSVTMTTRAALRSREDGRAGPLLQTSLATELPEGQKNSIPIPLSRAFGRRGSRAEERALSLNMRRKPRRSVSHLLYG